MNIDLLNDSSQCFVARGQESSCKVGTVCSKHPREGGGECIVFLFRQACSDVIQPMWSLTFLRDRTRICIVGGLGGLVSQSLRNARGEHKQGTKTQADASGRRIECRADTGGRLAPPSYLGFGSL